jgi:transcriptional regulator of acetoin/glycerol metabolism
MITEKHDFHNDLNAYCSANERKKMVLELISVYGTSMTLKRVLDDLDYQLDKRESLLMSKIDDVLTLNRADMEDLLAREALKSANGNVTRAAEALGVSRATMYRKKREIEK